MSRERLRRRRRRSTTAAALAGLNGVGSHSLTACRSIQRRTGTRFDPLMRALVSAAAAAATGSWRTPPRRHRRFCWPSGPQAREKGRSHGLFPAAPRRIGYSLEGAGAAATGDKSNYLRTAMTAMEHGRQGGWRASAGYNATAAFFASGGGGSLLPRLLSARHVVGVAATAADAGAPPPLTWRRTWNGSCGLGLGGWQSRPPPRPARLRPARPRPARLRQWVRHLACAAPPLPRSAAAKGENAVACGAEALGNDAASSYHLQQDAVSGAERPRHGQGGGHASHGTAADRAAPRVLHLDAGSLRARIRGAGGDGGSRRRRQRDSCWFQRRRLAPAQATVRPARRRLGGGGRRRRHSAAADMAEDMEWQLVLGAWAVGGSVSLPEGAGSVGSGEESPVAGVRLSNVDGVAGGVVLEDDDAHDNRLSREAFVRMTPPIRSAMVVAWEGDGAASAAGPSSIHDLSREERSGGRSPVGTDGDAGGGGRRTEGGVGEQGTGRARLPATLCVTSILHRPAASIAEPLLANIRQLL